MVLHEGAHTDPIPSVDYKWGFPLDVDVDVVGHILGLGTWDLVPMPLCLCYAMDLVVSVPGVVLGWSNPIQSNPRRLGLIYPKE